MNTIDSSSAPSSIGILGGTFDPIHRGHLALAYAALENCRLSRIAFLPASSPYQKSLMTAPPLRAAMVQRAIEHEPKLELESYELDRTGISYTIDTLRELRKKHGDSVSLVFLMGCDQWVNLHTWKDWQFLLNYANFAICSRGEAQPNQANQAVIDHFRKHLVLPKDIAKTTAGKACFFNMPPHDASSSLVRLYFANPQLAQAQPLLEKWLPFSVMDYIRSHKLY